MKGVRGQWNGRGAGWLAGLVCAVCLCAGCGRQSTVSAVAEPGSEPQIDESRQLVVYTAHKREVYQPILEEFEERTGIWVRVEAGGTTEMLRRIRQESQDGTAAADVMFGGGIENLELFGDYFEPYHVGREGELYPSFVSEDGLWTPFTELPIVFIYNRKLVPEEKAPGSWKEFLDGTWDGQISFADPEKSGTSLTILETLRLVNREQGWYDSDEAVLERFATGLQQEMAAGSGDVPTEVASGHRKVGITLEETALKSAAAGSDVAIAYPAEGTSAVPDGTAIVKGTDHEANAQQFLDFTVSDPVQRYVVSHLYRRSVRTDVEERPDGEEVRVLDFDVQAASTEEREVLEKFLQYVHSPDGGDQDEKTAGQTP